MAKVKKIQTKQNLESQIHTLEKLLENEPEKISGRWNPKFFKLSNKIKKLKKDINNLPVTNLHESWNKFLAK